MPLTIYYCFHTEEAFNSVFDELFAASDIIVVENGFDGNLASSWEITYNQLSKGELMPQDLRSKSGYEANYFGNQGFVNTLQDRIFKSAKTIYFEHSPLTSHAIPV